MSTVPDILESPEEVLSTLRRDGKRRWLYPVESAGRFLRQRKVVGWILIVTWLLLPIIPIAGRPAVLLDVVRREFALFGLVFYPTDTVLLMAFLIGMITLVILATAMLGRVWCGWGCPQTVYLEFIFRPIERFFEGREVTRKRRDEGPASWDRTRRKTAKWTAYTLVSVVLAHTFVAYFVGWDSLLEWMTGSPREHWGVFVLMAATTGLILFDFGYFREQMCTITCPYARMQSVLLDPDSLIVSYDPGRGEPRGKPNKKAIADGSVAALGDCIDCAACVRTCPTGIDIRDGLQMECIACTQCIDACDAIMDRVDKPRGLIRYTSENALAGKTVHRLRPRTVLYSLLLVIALSAFTTVVVSRQDYDVNVGRVAGQPYSLVGDEQVANRLRFRVRNQTPGTSGFSVSMVNPAGEVRPVGTVPVLLEPGEMKRLEVWALLPQAALASDRMDATFRIDFRDGSSQTVTFPFLGPTLTP
ncbi:MAG: cytochrome c oxidase accessory protein CcoG [Rhodothermales bacterium]|nr:cytochrome c oxidase accessory protein CcoG [Rhodothermales bacterium]MBO6781331.1 cytochrome c oxidase accessory protein CcoG [Rhodothermales bacterium]